MPPADAQSIPTPALFFGSAFGLSSDACPVDAGAAPNLASELFAAGYTFGGFAEDLAAVGATACSAGKYARKHARNDYASLPTVSFAIASV